MPYETNSWYEHQNYYMTHYIFFHQNIRKAAQHGMVASRFGSHRMAQFLLLELRPVQRFDYLSLYSQTEQSNLRIHLSDEKFKFLHIPSFSVFTEESGQQLQSSPWSSIVTFILFLGCKKLNLQKIIFVKLEKQKISVCFVRTGRTLKKMLYLTQVSCLISYLTVSAKKN